MPMRSIGRYQLFAPIATGGMASVHLGRLQGPAGFQRTVAIKRMLQEYATNPRAREMLIDEARLSSRVRHANVVQTLDVVEHEGELFLVLELVQGESLDQLLARARERGQTPPVKVTVAMLAGVLRGLHAAHEARAEDGRLLELVHRDLSPHNILVDVNGVARVLDFGVARARGRLQSTRDGQLKGKLAYLAPEQVHGESSRRSDLFTAGVVLWECLAGRQLFDGAFEGDLLAKVLLCKVPPLSSLGLNEPRLQAVLDRALDREPERRFSSARDMAEALDACGPASATEVAAWVSEVAADRLRERSTMVEALERSVAPGVAAAPRRWARGLTAAAALLVALAAAATWWGSRPAPSVAPVVLAPVPPPAAAAAPPVVVAEAEVSADPPVKPPRSASRKRARSGCTPPYVIDSAGVKRFKVACLR